MLLRLCDICSDEAEEEQCKCGNDACNTCKKQCQNCELFYCSGCQAVKKPFFKHCDECKQLACPDCFESDIQVCISCTTHVPKLEDLQDLSQL